MALLSLLLLPALLGGLVMLGRYEERILADPSAPRHAAPKKRHLHAVPDTGAARTRHLDGPRSPAGSAGDERAA
ncbi:hypothetical protein [Streptomyces sp. NPDC018031]|uniref:hypothetical protein n=1 Tax=Streptomyces sp. NPDC018031 TaxID=3365033 RepID=UPI0037B63A3D